ncbi:DAK2 domain-containing protein, partial [Aeromonas veronii]
MSLIVVVKAYYAFRGNSGVILSQLFRGFCKNIEQEQQINAQQLAS